MPTAYPRRLEKYVADCVGGENIEIRERSREKILYFCVFCHKEEKQTDKQNS
ncbi:CLUMA_CG014964, isoform A [Clunio marinus]|uniref:CLUMA_CG014964, isoform A n=1 Tax=Clunio marinus TaxID=568069 RepID=A0A1J1IQC8_9DIPT|nr:CLUMA_CG014964, isoform A [Clunio marinus]